MTDHPEGPPRGCGVFSHGFTLGKDSPAAPGARMCKQLAAESIGMLRFDNFRLGAAERDGGDGSHGWVRQVHERAGRAPGSFGSQ